MNSTKNTIKYINAHHIECSRASKFSLTPNVNSRRTELYLFNKSKNTYGLKKYPVEDMNFTKKSIIKEMEDEFTKCEIWFKELIVKINSRDMFYIDSHKDKQNLSTYIAVNLCRNPDNLDKIQRKIGKTLNKFDKNLLIDEAIKRIAKDFYDQINMIEYYSLTTNELLVCPDSIIYSLYEKSSPNIMYHIMPICHNKYIIGCFEILNNLGYTRRIDRKFTATEINNFSFMSDCSYLCSDDKIIFNHLSNYQVNNLITY